MTHTACVAHMAQRDPAQLAGTVMTADISESEIRITYQISRADVDSFGWLVPEDGRAELQAIALPPVDGTMRQSLIRVDRTQELTPRFISAELRPRIRRDELTGAELPPDEEAQEKDVFAVWSVDLASKAEVVEFVPPQSADGRGRIGMQVRHLGLAVNDFTWWQAPVTFLLDWADPWYSKAADPRLRRAFAEPLEIYVVAEANEVRLEIAARPADWLGLPAMAGAVIPAEDKEAMLQRMEKQLGETLEVRADGKAIPFPRGILRFLTRALDGAEPVGNKEPIPVAAALTGAIYTSKVDAPPRSLELEMSAFPSRIQRVPVTFRHSEGVTTGTLAPAQPSVRWSAAAPPATPEPAPPGGVADFREIRGPWAALALLPGLLWAVFARQASWPVRLLPALVLPVIVGIATGWSSWSQKTPKPIASPVPMTEPEADIIVRHVLNHCMAALSESDPELLEHYLARSAMPAAAAELKKHLLGEFVPESLFGTRNRFRRLRWENNHYPTGPTSASIPFVCDLQVVSGIDHWGHSHNHTARFRTELEIRPGTDGWQLATIRLSRL